MYFGQFKNWHLRRLWCLSFKTHQKELTVETGQNHPSQITLRNEKKLAKKWNCFNYYDIENKIIIIIVKDHQPKFFYPIKKSEGFQTSPYSTKRAPIGEFDFRGSPQWWIPLSMIAQWFNCFYAFVTSGKLPPDSNAFCLLLYWAATIWRMAPAIQNLHFR